MTTETTPTILIIDDEPDILELLCRIILMDDYNCLVAESAEEGLKIMSNNDVDVVICDYVMPGESGTDFLKTVRSQWPRTVRIMITGYADFEAAVQAINECKVFRMIVKPWNNAELRGIIKQALEFKGWISDLLKQVHDQERLLVNV
jgi:DNA-binding NtrC family response regulator